MILGKNLVLALNNTPLAAARSCNLDTQQSFLPVASPYSGKWQRSTPERLSWSASAEALIGTMAAYNALLAAQVSGTLITVRIYDAGAFGLNQIGSAYIETLHLEGSVGTLCKMSATLRGSDKLSTYSGAAIPLTQYVQKDDTYIVIREDGEATQVSEYGALATYSEFTLTERTFVRIDPKDCLMLLTTDTMVRQPFEDGYDFSLENYGCTQYSGHVTGIWLEANTYGVIISYEDDSTDPPEILKLS